ncbi:MAG: cyclopropane-fatty-acyl-phospholipid synthase family protein [Pseudomonadota bacterium]|nr:cyclopropane-fatty-acyl-phospholipid synthase family protein [Pseudomonadota bacterium]
MLLAKVARRIIKRGKLTIIDADGRSHSAGKAGEEPAATIRLTNKAWQRRILLNPQLAIGEAYMEGALEPVDCDIRDVLRVMIANTGNTTDNRWYGALNRLRFLTRRIAQHNPVGRAKENVAHHYDLSDTLYDHFLDRDRFYSCAYFEPGIDDLEAAQTAKARHLAAKLRIRPGDSVLDIGSGWGSLALHLSRLGAGRIDGVTLSEEQHAYARRWMEREGADDRVDIRLQDYRDVTERYDRIVSVGMFEHVGVGHYPEYFRAVRDLLEEDGIAVIHSIGHSGPPTSNNPWIEKYIFPGGYIPSLSEVLPVIERTGLKVTDVEILRLHYAETLRHWRQRFDAHREEIRDLYDERFCRMWEFYLAGSEMSFREGELMVFQIQLAKQHDAVPLTRDYITDFDRAHAKGFVGQAAE